MVREKVKKKLATYEVFIVVGMLMVIGTGLKLLRIMDFSSDWFWFIGGVALIIEGSIALKKERQFNRKYEVILRKD